MSGDTGNAFDLRVILLGLQKEREDTRHEGTRINQVSIPPHS